MGVNQGFGGRVRAVCGGTAVAAVVAGLLVAPAQAAPVLAAAAVPDCPAVEPVADVTAGVVGEGLTVVTGTEPQPFKVEVLGVLKDGIGAGHDLIMIKVSDLPGHSVVEQGGGIWAGMSGSPVYVNGKLLGAVSYGFTLAPSPIGGLTPAADMVDVLNLSGGAARAAAPKAAAATKVRLSAGARHDLAAKARVSTVGTTMDQLKLPLAVSGLKSPRLARLRSDVTKAGLATRVYAAGRATAPTAQAAPTERPVAGGNFSVLLSYGDVTVGGVGTTTLVCGDKAVAFGHPAYFAGPSTYGANDATSLAIVKDDTLGSFKLANFGGSFGTVDQDRGAAVRADLSAAPVTTPVVTTVRNYDTGRTRTGTSQVAENDLVPAVAAYAVWANDDNVFDEIGDGRQSASWTITGTRAGGKTFSVSRSDKYDDPFDVTSDSAIDVADAADALLNNDAEKVTLTGVTYSSTISTTPKPLSLAKVEVAVNGGKYSVRKSLRLKVGDTVHVRNTVTPYRSTTPTVSVSTFTVPKSARGADGILSVAGGQTLASDGGDDDLEDDTSCLFADEGCDDTAVTSLDSVIAGIKAPARRDDLVTRLSVEDQDTFDTVTAAKVTTRQREVVSGRRSIPVSVRS